MRKIYDYYKKFGHETIVMGASFRSVGEVRDERYRTREAIEYLH